MLLKQLGVDAASIELYCYKFDVAAKQVAQSP